MIGRYIVDQDHVWCALPDVSKLSVTPGELSDTKRHPPPKALFMLTSARSAIIRE